MTLTILRQSSKKLKNPLRIIRLTLLITYATRRLKRNYLVIWKVYLIGVCDCIMTLLSDALCDPLKDCPIETDLRPEDSVSQVASCQGALSTTSSKLLARQIGLDRRRP